MLPPTPPGERTVADFVVLPPRNTLKTKYKLSDITIEQLKRTPYKIFASYDTASVEYSRETALWRGKAESNKIEIR
jgi:hypothetical protein